MQPREGDEVVQVYVTALDDVRSAAKHPVPAPTLAPTAFPTYAPTTAAHRRRPTEYDSRLPLPLPLPLPLLAQRPLALL